MTDLFTIGQMAEYNHVTKKALMIYQKHGLLAPEKVDPETGYRYYTLQQCPALLIPHRIPFLLPCKHPSRLRHR